MTTRKRKRTGPTFTTTRTPTPPKTVNTTTTPSTCARAVNGGDDYDNNNINKKNATTATTGVRKRTIIDGRDSDENNNATTSLGAQTFHNSDEKRDRKTEYVDVDEAEPGDKGLEQSIAEACAEAACSISSQEYCEDYQKYEKEEDEEDQRSDEEKVAVEGDDDEGTQYLKRQRKRQKVAVFDLLTFVDVVLDKAPCNLGQLKKSLRLLQRFTRPFSEMSTLSVQFVVWRTLASLRWN